MKTWSQVVFFLSLGSLLLDTQGSGISFPPWVSVFPSVKQGGWHLPRLTLPQQDFWQFDVYKLVIGQTIVSLGTGPIKVKMPGLDFHMPLAFQSPTFKAFFFFFLISLDIPPLLGFAYSNEFCLRELQKARP